MKTNSTTFDHVLAAMDELRRLDEADDPTFDTADVAADRTVRGWLSSSPTSKALRAVLERFGTLPESAIPQDPREVVRLLLKSPVFAG